MRQVPAVANASIHWFRQHAFSKATPYWFPKEVLVNGNDTNAFLPASENWFKISTKDNGVILNQDYFSKRNDFNVPVEIYTSLQETQKSNRTNGSGKFERVEMPFSLFAEMIGRLGPSHNHNLYVAQCPIASLPSQLRADVPAPKVVRETGRGDVYDSSIWIGRAPTFTPLHKDPNPNFFFQMAGEKNVRLFEPHVGAGIFHEIRRYLGGNSNASFRGEEMMQGQERQLLEDLVWNGVNPAVDEQAVEVRLEPCDALFIPKGWWHSIKGTGTGINGSVRQMIAMGLTKLMLCQVNWWFR